MVFHIIEWKGGLGDAAKHAKRGAWQWCLAADPAVHLVMNNLDLDRIMDGSDLYALRFNPNRAKMNGQMPLGTPLGGGAWQHPGVCG